MKLKKLLSITVILVLAVVYIGMNIHTKPILNDFKEDVEVLSNISTRKEIGEKKAIELVKDYLKENGDYIADNIEVDSVDNKYYIIHVYDIVINQEESHTATTGWYQVNKLTGEIINIMQ